MARDLHVDICVHPDLNLVGGFHTPKTYRKSMVLSLDDIPVDISNFFKKIVHLFFMLSFFG
jgi:hypothetical protein